VLPSADDFANNVNDMSDYEVVTSRKLGDLQDRVRKMMLDGFVPLGGISMLHEEEAAEDKVHMVFAQALARQETGRRA
jgi:hypothetical protein